MSVKILEGINLGQKINTRWLWRNLSFSLHAGESLGLVGATGTGKSVLLRAIAHLNLPLEGEIIYQNKSLSSWHIPSYRSQVIYLHQRSVMFEGTVEDNLKLVYGLGIHKQHSYDVTKIDHLLDLFERPSSFLGQSASNLSGGETQIVALIRALQLEPTVLLLDECSASLDGKSTNQVEQAIALWRRENPQRACIWTSHDNNQITRVTEKQLIIENGK
ncbi:ABC transporter ATP-binding protein [Cyanobacterium sp. IPPAS B-1200]|uniref:ABC transporter ATP-binding protein n=1 Tax=Cyanobacterium sp. IPPAS B-1200 TaxID=1562720 RepID=UPI0008527AAB|nr:ATP-binding cassette domain-containing protein [Cyanobacterium sp. IPPAS B-1200]OEJ78711.1 ABC transporter [Cyanobacterium sp. IPPAS B-1200]